MVDYRERSSRKLGKMFSRHASKSQIFGRDMKFYTSCNRTSWHENNPSSPSPAAHAVESFLRLLCVDARDLDKK